MYVNKRLVYCRKSYLVDDFAHHAIPLFGGCVFGAILSIRHQIEFVMKVQVFRYRIQQIHTETLELIVWLDCGVVRVGLSHHIWLRQNGGHSQCDVGGAKVVERIVIGDVETYSR